MEDMNLNLKSETIDKAIDTFGKPLYDDVAKPAIQTTKNTLSFCSQFIVSGIKPFMYSKIKECEYKIKEIDKRLEKKYNHILDENKTEPRINILGPAVDVLKYNLEEEHIKEMFINIIGNDMDKSKQSKVLPSYIEIVKQLSSEDAKTLCLFKKVNSLYTISHIVSNAPIMKLKYTNKKTHGYFDYNKDTILILDEFNFHVLDSIVVDNLLRLKLIEIDFSKFLFDQPYDSIFNTIRKDELFKALDDPSSVLKLDYSKGILELTAFGKNFIDICLS